MYSYDIDSDLSSHYVGVRLFTNHTLNIPSGGSINLFGRVNNSNSQDSWLVVFNV